MSRWMDNKTRFRLGSEILVPDWKRYFTVDELIKYIPGFRFEGMIITVGSGRSAITWGAEGKTLVFPGADPDSAKSTMLKRLENEYSHLGYVRIKEEGVLTEIVTPCPAEYWLLPSPGKENDEIEHEDMMEYIESLLKSWYKDGFNLWVYD